LLLEGPSDPDAWDVDDQFMLGSDLLVAPVLEAGARARQLYLPAGESWRDAWDGTHHEGGQSVTVDAPIGRIPVFQRAKSALHLS
jgi:alpha-D-xyloside xylohydrolase